MYAFCKGYTFEVSEALINSSVLVHGGVALRELAWPMAVWTSL